MKSKMIINAVRSANGPGAVYKNLIDGFVKLNYPFYNTALNETNDLQFFSNDIDKSLKLKTIITFLQPLNLPPNIVLTIDLLGPNVFVLPREFPNLVKSSKALIVPSEWCRNKYKHYDSQLIEDRPIYVWPVGINTDDFSPEEKQMGEKLDILVYFKRRNPKTLEKLTTYLQNHSSINSVNVVYYGKYNKESLKQSCNNADAVILLDNTESQGIATLEMLSMNKPMFVLNQTIWDYNGFIWEDATSVPYFSEDCGFITNKEIIRESDFEEFITKVKERKYEPRNYILNNFTLEKRAKQLIKLGELAPKL